MTDNAKKTAPYKIITDAGGNKYRFFCALSGAAMCTTKLIRADTQEEELQIAWETEGRQHFNFCHKCGSWVSTVMYNADVLECVDCAPWEERPAYCSHCGEKIPSSDTYCRKCGLRLQYREVWA